MRVIEGRRIFDESDEEFYARQIPGARPHDKDRFVQARLGTALRFLMHGGTLEHTSVPVYRARPDFGPEAAICDVGCRDGWSLTYLGRGCRGILGSLFTRRTYKNTTGFEISPDTVAYARAKGRNVIEYDILRPGGFEEAFDIIFTCRCLDHLEDPALALANMARMLKGGGTLLAIVRKEERRGKTRERRGYRFSGESELAQMAKQAGFEIESSFTVASHIMRKRKYWYRLVPRVRKIPAELWVVARRAK